MAQPQNRSAILAVLKILEPKIIGQESEGFSCGCGAIHCGAAKAVAIEPAGGTYPGQEVDWYLWTVNMRENDKISGYQYSVGLSKFVPVDELEAIFAEHFTSSPDDTNQQYRLKIAGEDRVRKRLPPAVRIQDNNIQTRFSFDWGSAQQTATELATMFKTTRSIPYGSNAYKQVVTLLKILEPEIYLGGPAPQLEFESRWLTNYREAIEQCVVGPGYYDHVFFQNITTAIRQPINIEITMDVVFAKEPQ